MIASVVDTEVCWGPKGIVGCIVVTGVVAVVVPVLVAVVVVPNPVLVLVVILVLVTIVKICSWKRICPLGLLI